MAAQALAPRCAPPLPPSQPDVSPHSRRYSARLASWLQLPARPAAALSLSLSLPLTAHEAPSPVSRFLRCCFCCFSDFAVLS